MSSSMAWPGYTLDVDRDGQWIESSIPELDPDWKSVDENGHGHFVKDRELPTLKWVSEPCTMGHGDDCDAEGHYECRTCEALVVPGTRTPKPFWVAGLTTYTLTTDTASYVFGPRQWDALVEAMHATIAETLSEFCVQQTYRT